MTWTARQARYQNDTLEVCHDTDSLTKHYVLTRHGAVARSFLPGSLHVTVALWRRRRVHPQFQGWVQRDREGRYVSYDPLHRQIAVADNYLDAEAPLLLLRTRTRSHVKYRWPDAMRRAVNDAPHGFCQDCGTPLAVVGGVCQRPDLHW